MRYAFIDPETTALVISTEVPSSVTMYWEVDEDADANQLAIDNEGELAVLPSPRQYPWQEWDFVAQEWIDVRTPEERERIATIARNRTSISRTDFVVRATGAGIITPVEAILAAKGEIPASMQSLFDGMPPETLLEASIRWAGATTVERTNPLIVSFAAKLGIPDAQLDQLFGVEIM